MTNWIGSIIGNEDHLQRLEKILANQDPTIIRDNKKRWIIKSSIFCNIEDDAQARTLIQQTLNQISALSILGQYSESPLELDTLIRVNKDGTCNDVYRIIFQSSFNIKGSIQIFDNEEKEIYLKPESVIIPLLKIIRIDNDEEINEILKYIFADDYKLAKKYSIIERIHYFLKEQGKREGLNKDWWQTTKKYSRTDFLKFQNTVCSPELLGPNARHGSPRMKNLSKEYVEKNYFTINEAQRYADKIIYQWLFDKIYEKGRSSDLDFTSFKTYRVPNE